MMGKGSELLAASKPLQQTRRRPRMLVVSYTYLHFSGCRPVLPEALSEFPLSFFVHSLGFWNVSMYIHSTNYLFTCTAPIKMNERIGRLSRIAQAKLPSLHLNSLVSGQRSELPLSGPAWRINRSKRGRTISLTHINVPWRKLWFQGGRKKNIHIGNSEREEHL
jgi:hypothetical protein